MSEEKPPSATCKDCGTHFHKALGEQCPECEGVLVCYRDGDRWEDAEPTPQETMEKIDALADYFLGKNDGYLECCNEISWFIESQAKRIEELKSNQTCCHCGSKDIGFYTCEECEKKEDERYRKQTKRIEELEDTLDWIDDLAMSESYGEGGSTPEERFRKIRECCKESLPPPPTNL
jgi:hypothetical protein